MKTKKVLLISGAIAAVGAGLYFIFRRNYSSPVGTAIRKVEGAITGEPKVESTPTTITPTTPTVVSPGQCSSYRAEAFPLEKCMKGEKVRMLQKMLNSVFGSQGGFSISEDGYFGPATERAVEVSIGAPKVTEVRFNAIINQYNAEKTIS
jgi:hypothetical protein